MSLIVIHHDPSRNGKAQEPAPEPVCLVRIHPDGERFYLQGWNHEAGRPQVHPDPDRALWWPGFAAWRRSDLARNLGLCDELIRRGFCVMTAAKIHERRHGTMGGAA